MPSQSAPKRVARPRSTKTAAATPAMLPAAEAQLSPPSDDLVALRAYHLWLSEGRPDGRDLAHWIQAQSELAP
jgi:hypothetical protein